MRYWKHSGKHRMAPRSVLGAVSVPESTQEAVRRLERDLASMEAQRDSWKRAADTRAEVIGRLTKEALDRAKEVRALKVERASIALAWLTESPQNYRAFQRYAPETEKALREALKGASEHGEEA